MKFTDKEKELLEDMISFPNAFRLTPDGVEVAKGLYEKITKEEE
jgi:hypothetical protein